MSYSFFFSLPFFFFSFYRHPWSFTTQPMLPFKTESWASGRVGGWGLQPSCLSLCYSNDPKCHSLPARRCTALHGTALHCTAPSTQVIWSKAATVLFDVQLSIVVLMNAGRRKMRDWGNNISISFLISCCRVLHFFQKKSQQVLPHFTLSKIWNSAKQWRSQPIFSSAPVFRCKRATCWPAGTTAQAVFSLIKR